MDPPQHDVGIRQGWLSLESDTAEQWIQWDLGQSYTLGSIRVWNWNQTASNGTWLYASIQQLDIYISSVADPGDPEGAGAANWPLWAEDATFDLAPGAFRQAHRMGA